MPFTKEFKDDTTTTTVTISDKLLLKKDLSMTPATMAEIDKLNDELAQALANNSKSDVRGVTVYQGKLISTETSNELFSAHTRYNTPPKSSSDASAAQTRQRSNSSTERNRRNSVTSADHTQSREFNDGTSTTTVTISDKLLFKKDPSMTSEKMAEVDKFNADLAQALANSSRSAVSGVTVSKGKLISTGTSSELFSVNTEYTSPLESSSVSSAAQPRQRSNSPTENRNQGNPLTSAVETQSGNTQHTNNITENRRRANSASCGRRCSVS